MPFTTNLNIPPYYDDFDEDKNYHQILFRPSTAVQARELTQLQTILQNQIERFGSWAFKNGDIVQGCAINDLPVVPYVFLADALANGAPYDTREWVNCIAVSNSSNLQAKIVYANVGFQANYPNSNILYVKYLNTGTGGVARFSNNEPLRIINLHSNGSYSNVANVYTLANVSSTNTTGNAHGISVSEGIVYLSGAFVKVTNSTFGIVNAYGQNAGNSVVGFTALESIITENQDSSLNDNSLGYPNYNAPGAHRLKVVPTLVSLDPNTAANTKGFNPIAVYNYGVIVQKSSSTDVYSVVETALAKRTFDESGNYVVNPFVIDTVTGSGDANVAPSDANNMLIKVNPGVGYAQGYRVDVQRPMYVNMRRGTDTQTDLQQILTFGYGGYLSLSEVAGSFDFSTAQQVDLYDTTQQAVTTRVYSALNPAGNKIGTAMARCFSYAGGGNPGTNTANYYLHVFNVQLYSNSNINQVRSVYYSNGSVKGVGDLSSTGLTLSSQKSQLYYFGNPGIKNLRDSTGQRNVNYIYKSKKTGSIVANSGGGSITVTITGGANQLPYGIGRLAETTAKTIIITPTSTVTSNNLTGNVYISTTNTAVVGNNSLFTSELNQGDIIYVNSQERTVVSVTNSTYLTVDAPFNATGWYGYYERFKQGKHIYSTSVPSGATGYVNVSNTTSFDFITNKKISSSIPVEVTFDIEKYSSGVGLGADPIKKVVKKHRFVKLDTTTNPTGPWCLGFSDVHKINGVYASTSNSYGISGANTIDITNLTNFDSGQMDTHYGLSYLYPKSGATFIENPYILVDLDYFAPNTAAGSGYFSVESYPVDDANTANTNGILTKDIPLYVSESGSKMPLRDYVDFRPVCAITANDTGFANTSNTADVTARISYATLNPANTITFTSGYTYPVGGALDVPSYGQKMEADVTYYIPRRDLIMITTENLIKFKEGAPKRNPVPPIAPDNGMVLAEVYVPPYPSLTSDQLISIGEDNKKSTTLCRDSSQATSVIPLTNKRYTMKDIGKLDTRITNLEYYTQLSLLERATKDMTVTDANGLDRYKNGIFVEPFIDFSLGDTSNPEFSIAIDKQQSLARPRFVQEKINLEFSNTESGGTISKSNRALTLPYTEITFLEQPYATKYRSSSGYSYAWNGTMVLYPSYNNNTDTTQRTHNVTLNQAQSWIDFAGSPFGYNWGGWRSTTSYSAQTVITGSVDSYTYYLNYGWRTSDSGIPRGITEATMYDILTFNGITPSSAYVIGGYSIQYGGNHGTLLTVPGVTVASGGGGGGNAFAVAWFIGAAMGWW